MMAENKFETSSDIFSVEVNRNKNLSNSQEDELRNNKKDKKMNRLKEVTVRENDSDY